MDVNSAISLLENKYDIKLLFSLGLYNKFDKVDREYFDELNLKELELYIYLKKYLTRKLRTLLGEKYFVCLVLYFEEECDNDLSEDLESIKECGIQIPNNNVSFTRYIEEEELYAHYIFFEDCEDNLQKYIAETLAIDLLNVDPVMPCNVFYVKSDLTKVVNIYDDRGMDVLSLTHSVSS